MGLGFRLPVDTEHREYNKSFCRRGREGDAECAKQCRMIECKQRLYETFSATQRETAVTSFRGAKRTDSATNQLWTPEMATVRPSIRARYPSRATFSADIAPTC